MVMITLYAKQKKRHRCANLKKKGGVEGNKTKRWWGEGIMVKALRSHRFTDEALSSFKFKQ